MPCRVLSAHMRRREGFTFRWGVCKNVGFDGLAFSELRTGELESVEKRVIPSIGVGCGWLAPTEHANDAGR